MTDKFDSFSHLLKGALGSAIEPDADDLFDFIADDIVFEFPYQPEGAPRRVEGRAALADYLARIGELLSFGRMQLHGVHRADEATIVEFSCDGLGTETDAPYRQNYVSVIRTRGGKITHYRDYWNPDVLLAAIGGRERLLAAFAGANHA